MKFRTLITYLAILAKHGYAEVLVELGMQCRIIFINLSVSKR